MARDERGGFVQGTGKLSDMLADPQKGELTSLIRQALGGAGADTPVRAAEAAARDEKGRTTR